MQGSRCSEASLAQTTGGGHPAWRGPRAISADVQTGAGHVAAKRRRESTFDETDPGEQVVGAENKQEDAGAAKMPNVPHQEAQDKEQSTDTESGERMRVPQPTSPAVQPSTPLRHGGNQFYNCVLRVGVRL